MRCLKTFCATRHDKSLRSSNDEGDEAPAGPVSQRPSTPTASGGVLAPAFEEEEHIVLQRIDKSVRALVSKVRIILAAPMRDAPRTSPVAALASL